MITVYVMVDPKKVVSVPKPPKPHPTDNLPVVQFYYPRSNGWGCGDPREVKVIEASKTHIRGLEILENGKHQYKTFSRKKISGPGPWLKLFLPKSYGKHDS